MKRKIFGILFALVLALSLSLVPAVPASAGAITNIVYTPSGATVWTYVAASSTVCTFDPETAITAGSVITLTFPDGATTLASIVAADFTIEQAGIPTSTAGTATAPSNIDFNPGARTITFTVAADSLSFGGDHDGLGTVTIATSATASGDEIRHPISATTTGTFSVATSVTDSGSISNVVFVPGPATHLSFWPPQPTTAVAGVAIAAPNVVVKFQDSYGNVTADTDNITVAIDNNPGGGTLSGTLTVAAVSGAATFSDLSIDKVGTGYTLDATSGALTSNTSSAFNITPAPKSKLAFVQQPTSAVAGAAITPAVTVAIQDTYGNQTSDIDDITIAIDNNPGGGTLSGTWLVAAVNGLATFSNLSIDKVGTSYTLEATSGALTPHTSNAFNITLGALASFTISGTPIAVYVHAAFPSPVTVTAYDACLNIKTDYQGTVTWWSSSSIATLPADYTFDGGDAGVHIFPGSEFTLSTKGTQTITVTDAAVSATSSGIAVAAWTGGGLPPPDTTPPTISGISTSNITGTGADINWRTNELGTSQVEYWSSPSLCSPLDETMCCNHLVHLTDLTPGTTYHYKMMSVDSAGNLAVSDEHTFTTPGEAPAAVLSASDLSISPSEVNIGETVTISVLVANTGNAAGDYEVTLKINDVAEATREVTVAAGASEEVTFTTAKDVAGSYSVDVNGLSGSFTVKKPVPTPAPTPPPPPPPPSPPPAPEAINWWLIGGIIAAVIVIGSVTFILVRRRAR